MSTAASPKAFPVSWDQFHRDCRALAWRLADKGPDGKPFEAKRPNEERLMHEFVATARYA